MQVNVTFSRNQNRTKLNGAETNLNAVFSLRCLSEFLKFYFEAIKNISKHIFTAENISLIDLYHKLKILESNIVNIVI